VLKPIPVAFNPTEIAYGYTGVTFSGTVYHDEGLTTVGTGTGVALHINGAATATVTTTNGAYSFTNQTISENDVLTVFIDGESEDGALVMKVSEGEVQDQLVQGMDIYKDRLILRTSTASSMNLTTTNLDLANATYDADVRSVYFIASGSGNLVLGNAKELFVWSTTTHTMSGDLVTHDLDVRGTLAAGTGHITASGSVAVQGTLTISGDVNLTSVESGETLSITSSSLNNLYIDNGLEAYFRLDEGSGFNASGATLNSASGGSLTSGPVWVQTNTGMTTLFYNPFALEFDGSDDVVSFADAWDLSINKRRSFATWFRRKSADTEDVIFSKKAGSGSANEGYILYIDDESDKLNFELADGSNIYTVTSTSTITDQNWHHVGVSFNPFDNDETNIFLDGAIDVSAKAGSLAPSSDSTANSVGFKLGDNNDGTGPFEGTLDDFRIYNRVLSGSELSVLFSGYKTTGSGTYYIINNLDINGDFGIYAGTANTGSGYRINVAGDMSVYGELSGTGSTTLDGSDQTLRGSTAFNHLTKTTTTSVTLTFETNSEQTISGALTLQGAVSNQLSLVSSYTGSQAYLIAETGSYSTLKYLDVLDNNAFSGALMSCTEGCTDSGNNINWEFLNECGDGVTAGSEECDDGNSVNTDSCPNDCMLAVCGDSVIEGTETCDPPNTGNCQSNCFTRGSGGGNTGRRSSAASTASFFQRPEPPDGCGNGVLDTDKGEECDAGTRFNGLGACSYDCKKLTCGDGVISPQNGEDCEPTIASTQNGVTLFEVGTCGETCTAPVTTAEGTVWGGCRRMFLMPCGGASSSIPSASRTARCGNGEVDAGEECDFGGVCEGGQFDGSFWTDRNSVSTCVSGGGTTKSEGGDGCSDTCKTEFCGDGSVQSRGADNQPGTPDDEQCDNGSICSNDATKNCRLDDECGTGNTCEFHAAKNRSCTNSCKQSTYKPKPSAPSKPADKCGNGKKEGIEECDNGSQNGKFDSTCTTTCTTRIVERSATSKEPFCGNAIVDADEECDNGDNNSDMQPGACRTNCTVATCGDFVIDPNEQCDNGDGNSNFYSDTCRLDCILPVCGDGVLDSGEQCDGSLSCTPDCFLAMQPVQCGNAKRETGEQCDDGNTTSGDGCSRLCQNEAPVALSTECGNGIADEGEQCDDGNVIAGDGCSIDCRIEEKEMRKAAAVSLKLDADVVIVNPTEIASAIKYIENNDPCSTLVMKGQNQKATLIRAAAIEQDIPIVRNIELARNIYNSIRPGEIIRGELCTQINKIKAESRGVIEVPQPAPQPLPQAPTQFAYGYYPYAQVTPMITANPPAGETGPGLIGIAVAGSAGGIGWIRRRRKNLK